MSTRQNKPIFLQPLLLFCIGIFSLGLNSYKCHIQEKLSQILRNPKPSAAVIIPYTTEGEIIIHSSMVFVSMNNVILQNRYNFEGTLTMLEPFKWFKDRFIDWLEDLNGLYFYSRGLIKELEKDYSAALQYFQEGAKKIPKNAEIFYSRIGYCYYKLGCYPDAIKAYQQTIRIIVPS